MRKILTTVCVFFLLSSYQAAYSHSVFGDLDGQPEVNIGNSSLFDIFGGKDDADKKKEEKEKSEQEANTQNQNQQGDETQSNIPQLSSSDFNQIELPTRNPRRASENAPNIADSNSNESLEQQQQNTQQATRTENSVEDPNGNDTQVTSNSDAQNTNTQTVATDNQPHSEDAIFSYLLSLQMPQEEKQNLSAAIQAFYRKDFDAGLAAKARLSGEITQKVAHWYFLRSESVYASAKEIQDFYSKNPDWPSAKLLRKRAELSLFRSPPQKLSEVKAFFKNYPPITAQGKIALGAAYSLKGKKGLASSYFSNAWRHNSLDPKLETLILTHFSGLISVEDLKYRMDQLLIENNRANIPRAKKIAELIGGDAQKAVAARAAVIRRQAQANKLLTSLPENTQKDFGVKFSKIQHYRRTKNHQKALTLLQNLSSAEPGKFVSKKEWWRERRRQIRIALRNKKYELAYDIAKNHGQLSRKFYWEAEFLSGWIALRFLSDLKKAEAHFLALNSSVIEAKDKARSLYWLGRTALASQKTRLAQEYFTEASKFKLTYYGQIAEDTLGGVGSQIIPSALPKADQSDIARFFARDLVKAISVTHHSGLNTVTPLFLMALTRKVSTPGEWTLLVKMARLFGYPGLSVRIAKMAMHKGHALERYAYPTDLIPLPKRKLDKRVETAFVYALARQESEFNPKAKSPVGALGLMQIMPGTAEEIARKHNIQFNLKRLSTDGRYGLKLGAAHIGDLIQNYNGSLILTLVAYNAGPRRVREWISAYGDPRSKKVDVIDWVEHIPFTETRNYVKKIMAGFQVYRSYLSDTPKPHQIIQDLKRGSGGKSKFEQASNSQHSSTN